MQAEIEAVARAIKECTDSFGSPVHYYVEPEAQRRWQKDHPDDDWYETPEAYDDLASYRIIARAALAAVRPELFQDQK